MLRELDRARDHGVDADGIAARLALAREIEQVADDSRSALRLLLDRRQLRGHGVVLEPARQELRVAENDRERAIQLVRHAGRELADRRELRRLHELLLRRL